ncbi:MAG TPA: NADP-dependent malic enzyme [Patescibacteria group bacterium]|nr:NADP-dependent malic enzyme [Patescibacteria group bacterium]
MADIYKESLILHKKYQGKIKIASVSPLKDKHDLALLYTPGVAEPSRQIVKDISLSYDLTFRGRSVAVISDGSAVLGLGNIGPEAAMPVIEGKALLLKQFGDVDGVPIVINTQDPAEIVQFVKHIAPSFAGINLEDISAPRCFQIEESLQDIGIPVFHDDQHGTAIVVAAALKNAAKVVGKPYESLSVVVVGAGAAGLAISRMLLGLNCSSDVCFRIKGHRAIGDLIIVDTQGALYSGRDRQNIYKQAIAGVSNKHRKKGQLAEVIKGADVVIGVSRPNNITKEMVARMNKDAIVFALANPLPEIMPDDARDAGAAIVATGRSDFPNQINNVLVFPGVFRAVIQGRLTKITQEMKNAAADALADFVKDPSPTNIIPDVFAKGLAEHVAKAVLKVS